MYKNHIQRKEVQSYNMLPISGSWAWVWKMSWNMSNMNLTEINRRLLQASLLGQASV